jgi:hypothetical protein
MLEDGTLMLEDGTLMLEDGNFKEDDDVMFTAEHPEEASRRTGH